MSYNILQTPVDFQDNINIILPKKYKMFVMIYSIDILICIEDSGQPYIDSI